MLAKGRQITAIALVCTGCGKAGGTAEGEATDTQNDGVSSRDLSRSDDSPPNVGQNLVHWDVLTGVPQGLADGVDDTGSSGVSAGPGLTSQATGSQVTLSADFGGDGSAETVARSDHSHPAAEAGVVYINWGQDACPTGTELVYSGYAAGSHYAHGGGGGNTLCLTDTPTWDETFDDGNQNGGRVYGLEYQMNGYGLASLYGDLDNRDAGCAACFVPNAQAQLMIPGTQECPVGWTTEYYGFLMASNYAHTKSEFLCVNRAAQGVPGGDSNDNGNLWYPTEGECGSLPCPPYVQDRELTCSVCTR